MGFQIADQYSYLHFASGIIAYFWGVPFAWWVVIHVVFELVENSPQAIYIIDNYLKLWPGGKGRSDSFLNIVGDNIAAFAGWYSAYLLDSFGTQMGWYKRHITSVKLSSTKNE